jgi:hypothetical protein
MSAAEVFARSAFAQFISSTAGRALRVMVGAGMIYWGYTQAATIGGVVAIAVGVLVLAAGALNLCYISALLGGPLSGAKLHRP